MKRMRNTTMGIRVKLWRRKTDEGTKKRKIRMKRYALANLYVFKGYERIQYVSFLLLNNCVNVSACVSVFE